MIKGYFIGDKIYSTSQDAFSTYEKSRIGEKKDKKIEYSYVEALFLAHERKMKVYIKAREIEFENLLKRFKTHDKKIESKLAVYSDLKKGGYVIKTALKFGAEFRIYEKGIKPGDEHAKWILTVVKENEKINWHDFSARARVAHSTKKNLLIAVLDEEDDVTYYEVNWKKL